MVAACECTCASTGFRFECAVALIGPLWLERKTFVRPEPLGRPSLDLDAILVCRKPALKRQKLGVEGSCLVEVAGSRKLVFEVVVELEHVPEVFGAWEA